MLERHIDRGKRKAMYTSGICGIHWVSQKKQSKKIRKRKKKEKRHTKLRFGWSLRHGDLHSDDFTKRLKPGGDLFL